MFLGVICMSNGILDVGADILRTGDKLAMDAVTYKGIKTGIDFVATKMNKGKKPSKVLTTVAAVGATAMLSSQGVLPNSLVATAESVVGGVTGSKKLSQAGAEMEAGADAHWDAVNSSRNASAASKSDNNKNYGDQASDRFSNVFEFLEADSQKAVDSLENPFG
jgi:hypothetical protein